MNPNKPKLEIGKAYFGCGYYLRNLPTPSIQTWIYLGADIYGKDEDDGGLYHYFESPEIYFEKQISEETEQFQDEKNVDKEQLDGSKPTRLRVADNHLEALIYNYEGLKEFINSLGQEPNADKAF